LGKAFAMKDVPMNLISVSPIVKLGSIVHFENDNCFYQGHGDSCRIPLKERDGLFELDVNDWLATAAAATTVDPAVSKMPGVSFAVDGKCFGVMGDMHVWYRRMRHMSVSQLKEVIQRLAIATHKPKYVELQHQQSARIRQMHLTLVNTYPQI
jgi:hypothetical protein